MSDPVRSLSRRRVLQTGAGAATAGVLAACSSGSGRGSGHTQPGKAASEVSPTPRRQTLVVDSLAAGTVFDKFNPFIPNGETYNGGVGQIAKEYLWYANLATGSIKPWLGKSWSYAKDFQEFTLKLNPKAHWSDGKPLTSRDVKFTLQMIKGNPSLLGGGTVTEEISSVMTPDAHTVVVELKVPDPRYHYNFICGIVSGFLVVPQHIWSKQDPTKFANNPPVYSGPYKLQRTLPNQGMFVWQKDPNYWNADVMDPAPKYVVFRNPPTTDVEFQQFKAAAVDSTPSLSLYPQISTAIKGGFKSAVLTTMLDPCPDGIFFNCDPSKGLLADPRMRWAISATMDRQKIGTDIWPIDSPPATYPWPAYPNNKKWEVPSLAAKYPVSYDVKKAETLLDEMGVKAGSDGKRRYQGKPVGFEILNSTTSSYPEYYMARFVADGLRKVGLGATVKDLTSAAYSDRVLKGDYDMRQEWLCGEVFDPWQAYHEFISQYYEPIGKNATIGDSVRLKDHALDSVVTKLGRLDPESTAAKPVFTTGLEDWYKAMPVAIQIQKSFGHAFNTTFWTGWPTPDNLYMVPNNWWGQFLFIVGAIKPAGGS